MSFQIGSRVRWSNNKHEFNGSVGIVVDVVPNDQHLSDFNLYDVKFEFGLRTLHGSQLRPARSSVSSCTERAGLLIAHKQASDIYTRMVSELIDGVGTMAHVEFDFLGRGVAAAREALQEARERLNKHAARHGC